MHKFDQSMLMCLLLLASESQTPDTRLKAMPLSDCHISLGPQMAQHASTMSPYLLVLFGGVVRCGRGGGVGGGVGGGLM